MTKNCSAIVLALILHLGAVGLKGQVSILLEGSPVRGRLEFSRAGEEQTALPEAEHELPFEISRGRIYLEAYVNEKGPYRFMFDTGAEGMGRADIRLVDELKLPSAGVGNNSDGVNVRPIDLVRVETLRLGELSGQDLILSSRDYNSPGQTEPLRMGIIGRGFVQDYLVLLDYPGRSMKLYEHASLRADAPGVIRYEGGFRIQFQVGDQTVTGMIDTGSSLTFHFPQRLAREFGVSDLTSAGEGRRANTTFQLLRGQITRPLTMGAVTTESQTAIFSEQTRHTNIGGAFLQNFVLVLDTRHQLATVVYTLEQALERIRF